MFHRGDALAQRLHNARLSRRYSAAHSLEHAKRVYCRAGIASSCGLLSGRPWVVVRASAWGRCFTLYRGPRSALSSRSNLSRNLTISFSIAGMMTPRWAARSRIRNSSALNSAFILDCSALCSFRDSLTGETQRLTMKATADGSPIILAVPATPQLTVRPLRNLPLPASIYCRTSPPVTFMSFANKRPIPATTPVATAAHCGGRTGMI